MTDSTVTIEGPITSFTYGPNPDTGWAVARIDGGPGKSGTVVTGIFASLSEGDSVRVVGTLENSSYGRQVKAVSIEALPPSGRTGILRFFKVAKIPKFGPKSVEKALAHFGESMLDILEANPKRLHEVKGISKNPAVVDAIAAVIRDKRVLRDVMVYLGAAGVGAAVCGKIVSRYGREAMTIVKFTPYRLIDDIHGVGFKTADAIAKRNDIAHDAPERIRAGLIHTLKEAAGQNGCTCLPEDTLLTAAAKLLDLDRDLVLDALRHALERQDRAFVADVERERVYLRFLHVAEENVAAGIARLASVAEPMVPDPEAAIADAEAALGIELGQDQRDALARGMRAKAFVLTGGPGTGKTTCIRTVLTAARAAGLTVALAAPTGKAAKRMEEATGTPARTIHRLLGYNPENGWERNDDNPLEDDLIVIDETSMVDTMLMARLLAAVPSTSRVWFVGDVDQLPSVGPGQILCDIIDSGRVAVGRLDAIRRQAEGSAIIRAAHAIRHGQVPERGETGDDFRSIQKAENADIVAGVLETVRRLAAGHGYDPVRDIQVLAPMKKGDAGVEALNELLREELNPLKWVGDEFKRGFRTYRLGDRVIQTKNDYGLDLFNGDGGIIVGVDGEGRTVDVDFGDRVLTLEGGQLDNIMPAFALTIHKSQGSEYPVVIVVLSKSHRIMLRRRLLYTAVTRARTLGVLIGNPGAVAMAVKTMDDFSTRHTGLMEKLQAGVLDAPPLEDDDDEF